MNCREARELLCRPDDPTRNDRQSAELNQHLAGCADCSRIQQEFGAAISTWRSASARVSVPDADREWHAIRRRIRDAAGQRSPSLRTLFAWAGVPLAAVAAAAVVFLAAPADKPLSAPRAAASGAPLARVDSLEAPGNSASTMVFVDDQSGWLIVWASDAPAGRI